MVRNLARSLLSKLFYGLCPRPCSHLLSQTARANGPLLPSPAGQPETFLARVNQVNELPVPEFHRISLSCFLPTWSAAGHSWENVLVDGQKLGTVAPVDLTVAVEIHHLAACGGSGSPGCSDALNSCLSGCGSLPTLALFSETFPPSDQSVAWDDFEAQLSAASTYTTIQFFSDTDPGYSCTGPEANTLCQAILTQSSASDTCDLAPPRFAECRL